MTAQSCRTKPMRRLPPTPLETFLQKPIPILDQLSTQDAAWHLSGGLREQELMAHPEPDSTVWLCKMAGLQRNRGRMYAGLAYVSQAIDSAMKADSPLDIANAFAIRASIQTVQGNYQSARLTIQEIPPYARGSNAERIVAIYEETLAKLLLRSVGSGIFEFNESRERFQSAHQIYTNLNDIGGQMRSLIGLSSVIAGEGQYFRALELVDEGLTIASEHDDWRYLNQLIGCAAFAFRDQGYRQKVEDLFQLSIDWSTFIGDRPQRVRSMCGLGEFYRMVFTPPKLYGYDHCIESIKQSIAEAEECGLGPLRLQGQMALADLFQKAGEEESYRKCRDSAEKWAKSGEFEGSRRVMDWNDLIGNALKVSRERRMASRLEEAIEGSADPFFVFDVHESDTQAHGDLINEFRNSAANKMMELVSSEVRVLADLVHRLEFVGLSEPMLNAVNSRITYEDEIRLEREEGEAVYYARRVAPAGNGAVVTFRDVTSNRQIEAALREAADRASEADRAKTEFLANMSHEVRTPINGVLGLAQLLAELNLDPLAKKYVDGIASSGTILLKVIGDVLDLSKIEARKLHLEPTPTQIRKLLQDFLDLFAGKAANGGVELILEVASDVPDVIIVDDPSLRQILANLVGNALKFTREGQVRLIASRGSNRLHFQVADSGVGVPQELLGTIFEPFQRAGAESDGIGGTGLGLTISRRLVELMGGKISVTSVHGTGSTFYFDLPLEIAEVFKQEESHAPSDANEARFDNVRVLLVEDNSVNVLVSEGMLHQLGCDVVHAENGEIALGMLATGSFDLVLMDVRMPVMDGLSATVEIRKREFGTGRHTKVIALTAGALAQEREACFESGMDDYLVKPFSKAALRETMYRNLSSGKAAPQAISTNS